MSFKFKFILTIISLIVIVFLGINMISKGERYETVLSFNNNISNYESGEYFKIRGIINYAKDNNLNELYIDGEKQKVAVFNLVNSKDTSVLKVIYNEEPKVPLFGPAIVGKKEVLISGYFLKDTTIQISKDATTQNINLKNLLVSNKMQTQCESKYSDQDNQ